MMNNKWKYKINATHFYYSVLVTIEEKGKLMAKAIKKLPLDKIEMYCGDDLEDLAEQFDNITGIDGTDEYEEVTPVEEFDNKMVELYDMADRYDIWIEIK